MSIFAILTIVAALIFLMFFSIAKLARDKQLEKRNKKIEEELKQKGFINKMNHNKFVSKFGKTTQNSELEKIFNRAKNPWRMTIPTFQFIRYSGLFLSLIIAASLMFINYQYSLFAIGLGVLCFWYPMYYYKAIGDEREAEWNKTYEYIWVIKHNLMLYDPAKAYMNVKMYVQTHAPHNAEIIQGFDDFYRYWSEDGIDPYIQRFYPFSVTREITQIIYNMSRTGEFPEDSLNSLRSFIINSQNLTVEKTLSSVSGQATVYSLPFMMFSVIVALMVPLGYQLLQFF